MGKITLPSVLKNLLTLTSFKGGFIIFFLTLFVFSSYGQTITSGQLSATGDPLNLTGGDGTVVRIDNITDNIGSDNNGAGYRTGTATATTDRTYTVTFVDGLNNPVLMNSVSLDLGFFNNDVDNPNPGNGGLEGINNISVNIGTASIVYNNIGGEAPTAPFYTDYFPSASNPNNGNWTAITVPAGTIYAPNDGSFDSVANGTATITSSSDFSSITFTHDYLSPSGNPFGIVISELRYTVAPIIGPCTTPAPITGLTGTTIAPAGTASFTAGGGAPVAPANFTWAISPATGVSPASGTGASTGTITFANSGVYIITYTATNSNDPAGCTPAASTTARAAINVLDTSNLSQCNVDSDYVNNGADNTLGTFSGGRGTVASSLTRAAPVVGDFYRLKTGGLYDGNLFTTFTDAADATLNVTEMDFDGTVLNTFSGPVTNPIIALTSIGGLSGEDLERTIDFNVPFTVVDQYDSAAPTGEQGATLTADGTTGIITGQEDGIVVQFIGTFTSIEFVTSSLELTDPPVSRADLFSFTWFLPTGVETISNYTAATCTSPATTHDATVDVSFINPPTTGTLDVSFNGGTGSTSAPFTSVETINITGITADGTTANIMADFSADAAGCENTLSATANAGCTPPVDPCDPISGNPDFDGDGITDICDLDDDNDGVLDIDEMELITIDLTTTTFGDRNSSGDIVYTDTLNDICGTNDVTLTFTRTTNVPPHVGTSNGTGSYFQRGGDILLSFSEPVQGVEIDIDQFNDADSDFMYNFMPALTAANFTLGSGHSIDTSGSPIPSLVLASSNGAGAATITTIEFPNQVSTISWEQNKDGIAAPYNTPSGYGTTGIAMIRFYCDIDSDGDGTPNRLQLDSDDDGCSDAAETGVPQAQGMPTDDFEFNISQGAGNGDENGDGLADVVDRNQNGIPDYQEVGNDTYNLAIDGIDSGACDPGTTPDTTCNGTLSEVMNAPNDSFNNGVMSIGQSFVAPVDGDALIIEVEMFYRATEITSSDLFLDIFNGDTVSGSPVYTEELDPNDIAVFTVSGQNITFSIPLATSFAVTTGDTYTFQIRTTDTVNPFNFQVDFTGSYADGQLYVNGAAQTGLDLGFQVDVCEPIIDDMDNVDTAIEDGAPGNGDGNGDGILDSTQPNVASIPDGSGTGDYVTIEISTNGNGDCTQITRMIIEQESDLASADPDFEYPYGLVDFTLDCLNPGESATIRYYWYGLSTLADLDAYRKYGPTTPGMPSTAVYGSNFTIITEDFFPVNGQQVYVIEYALTDGQAGEETGTDGEIIDPTGPAVSSLGAPESDIDGDGVLDSSDICPGGDDGEDVDNDGVPDFCDDDDDNDGILDADEGCTDFVFPEDFFIPLYHANIINSEGGQIFITGQDANPNGINIINEFTEIVSGGAIEGTGGGATNWPTINGATVKCVGADSSDPQFVLLTTTNLYAWGTTTELLSSAMKNTTAFGTIPFPVGITATDVANITSGSGVLAIITNAGEIYTTGSDTEVGTGDIFGDNGTGADANGWYQVQTASGPLTGIVDFDIAERGAFAVQDTGVWYTWGSNTFLGDGTGAQALDVATSMTLPTDFTTPLFLLPRQIEMVSSDGRDAGFYALHPLNGNIYALGENDLGWLGTNATGSDTTSWDTVKTTGGGTLDNVVFIGCNSYSKDNPSGGAITRDPSTGQRQIYMWGVNSPGGGNGFTISDGLSNPQIFADIPSFDDTTYRDINPPSGVDAMDRSPIRVATGGHLSMYFDTLQNDYAFVGHNADGSFGGTVADPGKFSVSPADVVLVLPGRDTDMDGLPDCLDNDSDADGCFDALEGDNTSLTLASVDANGVLTGPVDGNGIPTSANGGQDDVSAYDNTITGGECDDDNDGVPNNVDACPGGDDAADADVDGVPDFCDLDDDNDGILDSVECPDVLTVVDFSILTPAQRSTLSDPNGGTVSFDTGIIGASGMNITVDITSAGAPSSLNPGIVNLDMATVNNSFDNRRDASGTSGNLITFTYSEPVFFEITSEPHSFFGNEENIRVSSSAFLDGFIDTTTTVANVNPILLSDNGTIDTTGDSQPNYFLNGSNTQNIAFASQDYVSATGTGNPEQGNGTFWGVTSSGNTTMSFSVEYFRTDILEIPGREPYRIFIGTCPDSDGDGIVDSLDTDSDDDGCPDAVEAAGAFTQADLTTSDNLADLDEGAVDANGIPTNGGTSQQQATTADVTVMGPDTDGDGIADACDLLDNRPVVMDDVATTVAETPVVIDVLDNDPSVPTMGTIMITTPPANGTVTITDPFNTPDDPSDDVVEYTPNPGFSGEDIFEYELCDDVTPVPNCDTAMVTVTVTPVAVDDVINVMFQTPMPFTVTDIISNDIGDLDPTTFMIVAGSGPTNGTINDLGGGNFEYVPNAGFTGVDSFDYQICDTNGSCTTATVELAVPPAAIDDMVITPFETPINIDVVDNDIPFTMFDLTTLSIVTPPDPTEGTVVVNTDGTIDFIPAVGFIGTSTFVYEICDTAAPGGGDPCTQATVTVEVTGPPIAVDDESLANDPGTTACVPTVANDTDGTSGIDPSTVSLVPPPGVTGVVLDANGDVTSFTVPTEGTWEVNPLTGEICFTPMAGYTLDPTPVMYNIENNDGVPSNDATVTIDYVPVATDDISNGNTTGDPVVVSVLTNDTNGDTPDPATVMIVGANPTTGILTVPGEGAWSVTPTGEIVFTPEPGYTGDPAIIMYTVQDDEGNTSDPASITVTYDICNGLGTGDCDGDGTPNNMDPDPLDPCVDDGTVGDEDPTNPIWANADCDGDGTPNGMDPDPQDPCVDNGVIGDEDLTNPVYIAADCDGDGTPNGSDPDPLDPCVDDGTVGDEDPTNPIWANADCDGDGTPNGTDPDPQDPCVDDGTVGDEDLTNPIWANADCDGDGTPNGTDPDPQDPCLDDGTVGDEDSTNPIWAMADCDGDGTPNGSDPDPLDPCVDDGTVGDEDPTNPIWANADCDGDGTPNGDDPAPYDPCLDDGVVGDEDPTNPIWANADCDGDGTPNGTDPEPYNPCVDDGTIGDEDPTNPVWANADCDGDGTPNGTDPDPQDPCVDDGIMGDEDGTNPIWTMADCDGDGTLNGNDPEPYDPCVDDGTIGDEDITNPIWQAADCDGDGTSNGTDPEPYNPCVDDGVIGDEDTSNPIWQAADCDGDGTPNGTDPDPQDPCVDDGVVGDEDPTNPIWAMADCDGDGTPNGTDPDPLDPCVDDGTVGDEDPTNPIWANADCDGDGTPNGTDPDPQDPCVALPGATPDPSNLIWNMADCDGDGTVNGDDPDPQDPCVDDGTIGDEDPTNPIWQAADCDGDGTPNGTDPEPYNPCVDDGTIGDEDTSNPIWQAADCDGDGTPNGDDPAPYDPCLDDGVVGDEDPTNLIWANADCDGDGTSNGTDPEPYNPCVDDGTVGDEDPTNPIWANADCDGDGTPNGTDPDPLDPCVDDGIMGDEDGTNPIWTMADCDGDGTLNGNDPAPFDPCVDDGTVGDEDITNPIWQAADCDGDGTPNGTDPEPYNPCVDDGVIGDEDTSNPIWQAADCDGDGTPNGDDPAPYDPCLDDGVVGDEDPTNPIWANADCDGDGTPNGTDPDPQDPCIDDGVVGDEDPTNPIWANADCDGDGTPNGTDPDPQDPCVALPGATPDPSNPIWNMADCDGDGTVNGDDPDPDDPCVDDGVVGDEDPTSSIWANADCDGDGTPNGTDPEPYNPCVDDGVIGDEDTSNPIWQAADCDGDGTPNGDDPAPYDPCLDDGVVGDEDPTNPIWANADCDGDGTPNGTDPDPQDPCVDDGVVGDEDPTNPIWANADCDGDGTPNGTDPDPQDPCVALPGATPDPSNPIWNMADCDGDGTVNGDDPDPDDPCVDDGTIGDEDITNPIWQAADCDGDGVTNGQEIMDGTDPYDSCSYDPANQDITIVTNEWGMEDCDGDGVINSNELIDGTDPQDPCDFMISSQTLPTTPAWEALDCDGDGVTNGQEILDGTDPLDECDLIIASQTVPPSQAWIDGDCDGDGVTNGDEINPPGGGNPTDPTDPCDFNLVDASVAPTVAWEALDCDGDGVTNGQELMDGTDPLNECDLMVANQTVPPSQAWIDGDCDGDGVTNGDEVIDGTDPIDSCDFMIENATVPQTPEWEALDCDGDGVTNGDELLDGTNPQDPCDFIAASQTLPTTGDWMTADCDGDGVTNQDELNDGTDPLDLCDFIITSQTLPTSNEWMMADCDGDGVTNQDELNDGTNPLDPCDFFTASMTVPPSQVFIDGDCDGDGVTNGDELIDGTEPLDPCDFMIENATVPQTPEWEALDCDGDGVTNGDELMDGTDPLDPCDYIAESQTVPTSAEFDALDCDGDGEPNGTDPDPQDPCSFNINNVDISVASQDFLDADCDGDGVTNGDEIGDGTNPLDPCEFIVSSITVTPSDAASMLDCDGDGVSNGQEIMDGTNPQDSCDFDFNSQVISYENQMVQGVSNAWLSFDCDDDGILNGDEIADVNDNGIPDYLESNNNPNPNDEITIFDIMTPNGDGLNDVFVINGLQNFPRNTVTIYNRWGVEVYRTEGYGTRDNFFRGISEGRSTVQQESRLPVGTYYYVVEYVDGNGNTQKMAGPLYINRK